LKERASGAAGTLGSMALRAAGRIAPLALLGRWELGCQEAKRKS